MLTSGAEQILIMGDSIAYLKDMHAAAEARVSSKVTARIGIVPLVGKRSLSLSGSQPIA